MHHQIQSALDSLQVAPVRERTPERLQDALDHWCDAYLIPASAREAMLIEALTLARQRGLLQE